MKVASFLLLALLVPLASAGTVGELFDRANLPGGDEQEEQPEDDLQKDTKGRQRNQQCFLDRDELVQALSQAKTNGGPDSPVGQTYGWPVAKWCVKNIEDFSFLFLDAGWPEINEPLTKWDTSSARTMRGMFYGCRFFDYNLNNFNTEQVTDMSRMFMYAERFNKSLDSFETGRVTDFSYMFYGAQAFDRSVRSFITSSAVSMKRMFGYATSFNQNISFFDVLGTNDLSGMFLGAESFVQDLCAWGMDLYFERTNTEKMFRQTSCPQRDVDPDKENWPVSPLCVVCT